MNFYASWSRSDLWIPDYDPECHLLISTSSVSKFWKLNHYKQLPKSLIIDSGGFHYARNIHERLLPKEILNKQIEMLDGQNIEAYFCTLDYPIFDHKLSSNEKDRCISQTIAYAYEMKNQFDSKRLKSNIKPMAVIQGYDVDSLRFCAHELLSLDFPCYGLGSLLAVKQLESSILTRVEAVVDLVGTNLHIFGISKVSTIRKLRQMGIKSFDSARPAKSAMYNQIFFYVNNQLMDINSHGEINQNIPIPPGLVNFPCKCPICNGRFNLAITVIGHNYNKRIRSIHNYWHLKMAYLD